MQAQIQLHAAVHVYSDNLTDEQIRRALFTPCRDLPDTVASLRQQYGSRLAVMPDGPQTIATLETVN